jgi:hypothetical protein
MFFNQTDRSIIIYGRIVLEELMWKYKGNFHPGIQSMNYLEYKKILRKYIIIYKHKLFLFALHCDFG